MSTQNPVIPSPNPMCGIVMPISAIDGCSETHWADVTAIISASVESAGYTPNLVSNADEVGVIQKRIIQNLYENPIVVCDVSGKNPNVMFELGIRLAFDRPVVIIKDDKTSYTFDTAPIEHLTYPRDLRFAKIVEFKQKLSEKIAATHRASLTEGYTTFLKHFGEFKVAKLSTREVSRDEYLLEELRLMRKSLSRIETPLNPWSRNREPKPQLFRITIKSPKDTSRPLESAIIVHELSILNGILAVTLIKEEKSLLVLEIEVVPDGEEAAIMRLTQLLPESNLGVTQVR